MVLFAAYMPPFTVLLAEDSDVMRLAIRRILEGEPGIALIGEASSFAEAIRMAADLTPNVVVSDLHLPDERAFTPDLIKSQFLLSAKHVVAISIWNDEASKALAESYGAAAFLDKAKLGLELIPAILRLA